MAADSAPLTRREMEEKIIALAWKDADFRKRFVADPKGEFEKRLGTKLPASLKMTAHAEDENHLHFVIPAKPKANVGELSDADLEKVAGGLDLIIGSAVIAISVITAAAGSAIAAVSTKELAIPKW